MLQPGRAAGRGRHAFRKAIQHSPRYVEAHNNLANLYVAQKKELEALRVLGDALKFAPTDPQTLLITARIQLRRSNHPPRSKQRASSSASILTIAMR